MNAQIKNLEPLTVAFVRHVGPYEHCEAAWQRLCSDPAVLACMGPEVKTLGISYDDPDVTDSDKIRYDACVVVAPDFQEGEIAKKQEISGGKYAVLTHKGPYEGFLACYRWLYGQWLPESGHEPRSAPSLEIYKNDPQTTPPDKLVTEICVPLA